MPDQTLRQALETYRARVSILKKGYQQERYRIDQISRSPMGDLILRKITSVDVASYRDARLQAINLKTGKVISTATVRLELSLLSNLFDIARIEWGLCDDNPVKNVRKPKPPPGRDRRLTPREDRLILRYAHQHTNPELYSIIVIALETAMRQGEILSLRWENINFKTRVAHLPITKNGAKRDVPLSLKARDALMRLGVKHAGKVFGYSSNGLKSTWRFMVQKLELQDLHFHDLRHEACSRLFELGTLDVMEVAAISGHKSLAMLKRYTHLKAQRLVKKLEGSRSKAKQAILERLVPYPGVVEQMDGEVKVRLLDFPDLAGVGLTHDAAVQHARDTLLRRIISSLREDQAQLPSPDQYLESVSHGELVMIDPLGFESLAVD